METIPDSLLAKIKKHGPQSPVWLRLLDLYKPFIIGYLRKHLSNLNHEDAENFVVDFLLEVFKSLPNFERNNPGHFRNWLSCKLKFFVRDRYRDKKKPKPTPWSDRLEQYVSHLDDPLSASSEEFAREYQEYLQKNLTKILDLVRGDFEEKTWRAFELSWLQKMPTHQVAKELGITVATVRKYKSRVLKRLRIIVQELGLTIEFS